MTMLTAKQMLAWLETTSTGWKSLLTEHHEALQFPCDVMGCSDVAGLMQHIVAVELRYSEGLCELPITTYEQIPKTTVDELFATHDRAMGLLGGLLARTDFDWEQRVEYKTRSAGTILALRRGIFVHLCMHSVRHYAQLATLVRQHGIKPEWSMDYLFMEATRP